MVHNESGRIWRLSGVARTCWRRSLTLTLLVAGTGIFTALALPGCAVGYVTRQSATHLRVLAARQPVAKAVAEGNIPPAWLPALDTLEEARRFGSQHLGLPADDIYRSISLVRPGPMWVVTASPPDALEPVTWWFPVAGRVAYRGYYDREDADRFAARLQARGLDVLVQASSAFSSLGWFADPIRPSMLDRSASSLVDLVLHEAAHGLLYVKGHTDFNESFATFVGKRGSHDFFIQAEGSACPTCSQLDDQDADAALFAPFINAIAAELDALYGGPATREEKLAAREAIFAEARARSTTLPWRGHGYKWFAQADLDNAVILSLRRYGGGSDIFTDLLQQCDNDLPRMLAALTTRFPWRQLPRRRRREITPENYLQQLLQEHTGCLEDAGSGLSGSAASPDPAARPSPDAHG